MGLGGFLGLLTLGVGLGEFRVLICCLADKSVMLVVCGRCCLVIGSIWVS